MYISNKTLNTTWRQTCDHNSWLETGTLDNCWGWLHFCYNINRDVYLLYTSLTIMIIIYINMKILHHNVVVFCSWNCFIGNQMNSWQELSFLWQLASSGHRFFTTGNKFWKTIFPRWVCEKELSKWSFDCSCYKRDLYWTNTDSFYKNSLPVICKMSHNSRNQRGWDLVVCFSRYVVCCIFLHYRCVGSELIDSHLCIFAQILCSITKMHPLNTPVNLLSIVA